MVRDYTLEGITNIIPITMDVLPISTVVRGNNSVGIIECQNWYLGIYVDFQCL